VGVLVVALGNPLRGDDGVAHEVAALLHGFQVRHEHQLTPELAAEMQGASTVVFLDADPAADAPSLERIEGPSEASAALSHSMTPATIVALAARLYHFQGDAWICRLHARDFSPGTGLSPEAAAQIDEAARLVQQLVEAPCTSPR